MGIPPTDYEPSIRLRIPPGFWTALLQCDYHALPTQPGVDLLRFAAAVQHAKPVPAGDVFLGLDATDAASFRVLLQNYLDDPKHREGARRRVAYQLMRRLERA
jgi:hypothetical protein